jgi:hypothetical protein
LKSFMSCLLIDLWPIGVVEILGAKTLHAREVPPIGADHRGARLPAGAETSSQLSPNSIIKETSRFPSACSFRHRCVPQILRWVPWRCITFYAPQIDVAAWCLSVRRRFSLGATRPEGACRISRAGAGEMGSVALPGVSTECT